MSKTNIVCEFIGYDYWSRANIMWNDTLLVDVNCNIDNPYWHTSTSNTIDEGEPDRALNHDIINVIVVDNIKEFKIKVLTELHKSLKFKTLTKLDNIVYLYKDVIILVKDLITAFTTETVKARYIDKVETFYMYGGETIYHYDKDFILDMIEDIKQDKIK